MFTSTPVEIAYSNEISQQHIFVCIKHFPGAQTQSEHCTLKEKLKTNLYLQKISDRCLRVQNVSQTILIIDEKSLRHPYFENEESRELLEDFDWLRSI